MVMFTSEWVREVLDEVFIDLYQRAPEKFDDGVRIFADLHADLPDRSFTRRWISRAAKRLGIDERSLKIDERDYTIREIVNKLRHSKKYDEKPYNSVSRPIDFDNLEDLQTD